jgi:DNA-binding XRE family transcriptional regulator
LSFACQNWFALIFMNSKQFNKGRLLLGKSQSQMARLLGISSRSVQSFEQGWRNIPPSVERHLLVLLSLKVKADGGRKPCWEVRNCPDEWKTNCPAWEFKAGDLCWFINNTFCNGKSQNSWRTKMEVCQKCQVFSKLKIPND